MNVRGLLFSLPNRFVRRISGVLPGAIRSRMFLLVGLMLLPPLLLIASIYKQVYETGREQALMAEMEVAQGVATTFAAFMDGVRRDQLAVGRAIITLGSNKNGRIARLLVNAVEDYPALRNLSWVSPTGQVLASSMENATGRSLAHRQYFKKIIAGSAWEIGDITETGAFSNTPTVVIATAVRSADGKLEGMVVAGIEPSRIGEIALTQLRLPGGAISVFDSKGTLVFHNKFPALDWNVRINWKNNDILLRRAMGSREPQVGILSFPAHSGSWVSARVPITDRGWIAGAGRRGRNCFCSCAASYVSRYSSCHTGGTFLFSAGLSNGIDNCGAVATTGK